MNLKNLLLLLGMDFQVSPREVCTQPLKVGGGVGDQKEIVSFQRKVFTLARVTVSRTSFVLSKEVKVNFFFV